MAGYITEQWLRADHRPALNIGGWYDIFQWGTLQNFQNMRRRGSDPARAHQRVIIGPLTHTVNRILHDQDHHPD